MDSITEAPRSCFYCGEPALTNDHIIPDSLGGVDNDTNYVDACFDCNGDRGNMSIADFMALKGKTGPVPVGMTRQEYYDVFQPDGTLVVIICLHCKAEGLRIFTGGNRPPQYCSRTHKKKFQAKRAKRRKREEFKFEGRLTQTIGA